jgi:hypothetical protein
VIIGGSPSSQGRPSGSQYERAARFKMVRTTSRLRLIVVALAPSATRDFTRLEISYVLLQ